VDAVALVEDIALHLGIPTLSLMAEVKTGIEKVLESETREGRRRHIHFVFLSFKLFN
jgi:hypothetical protein